MGFFGVEESGASWYVGDKKPVAVETESEGSNYRAEGLYTSSTASATVRCDPANPDRVARETVCKGDKQPRLGHS